MKPSQGRPLLGITFVSALTLSVVVLLSARSGMLRADTGADELATSAEIAVEHVRAITLSVNLSAGTRDGIAELRTDGNETALVSVPADWERREVRGGPLSGVTSDAQSMGFIRWHIPAGVTVSFRVAETSSLSVRNPSLTPLLVLAKRVNVRTGVIDDKSIIVNDGAVRLWETPEK